MAEEQPKKRVTKPREVSADPKVAPRATARDAVAVPKKPRAAGRSKSPQVSAADRQRMIAERAYYLAEARSFVGGDCQADWYAAESWIDAHLSA
ncbi:DUF2934 domain-containing protein [Acidithiobacillus ferrooxidans]|jgi:hypothetical protein|uniref:DUF2934 domain-containing protein n=1 Tax=Acidithiobacillus ferrooxidans TaxID=920 RepID=UPI0013D10887|nr:DUF2934 domain-containing protein [Acidithiobacillus ferrooxidans]MBU2856524.1 DUF2934 domain-containing protein [Acidithiobacillus ferrooxidans]MBU2860543.1 DUF2934 domain-containing protein [Acidithiobacillus ferrooxidans]MCR2829864.1 DUF2934 domain-containing protein [Acidithiobacillus ferrooxidans]